MKRTTTILGVLFAVVIALMLWQRRATPNEAARSSEKLMASPAVRQLESVNSETRTNGLGDVLTDSRNSVFLSNVFPGTRDFFAKLEQLGLSPIKAELWPCPDLVDRCWVSV